MGQYQRELRQCILLNSQLDRWMRFRTEVSKQKTLPIVKYRESEDQNPTGV